MALKINEVLIPARLSFVHLAEPYAFNDSQKAKYSVQMIIAKKDIGTLKAIKAAIDGAASLYGDSCKLLGKDKKLFTNIDMPLHDGDLEKPKGGDYGPECADSYVMNAKNTDKPILVDEKGIVVTDLLKFYSGCYALVFVNFYGFNNSAKGIACSLKGVKFARDGEPLGGHVTAEYAFGNTTEVDFDPLA